MKNITTYAEALANVESVKALRKELKAQQKEIQEALLSISFVAKYDKAHDEVLAAKNKLEEILAAIGTQYEMTEEALNQARKVAWHFKAIDQLVNHEEKSSDKPAKKATGKKKEVK